MLNEPVAGEQFFGRSSVLNLIERRVAALKDGYRQNIALTGQGLSGKSSIIHHLLHNLKDEKIIPVYIEVIEESFSNFTQKFMGSILYNFLKSMGRPVIENLDVLINEAKNFIPNTISVIERIRDSRVKMSREDIYSELLNLASFIKEETHRSCIIIFDEFHNLANIGIKNPFAIFGKKIMVQKDTMYIVTSSRISSVKKILSEKLSLLFGNFEAIEIEGFDPATAHKFLSERLGAVSVASADKNFIISITGGNPFYLDILSRKIRELGEKTENKGASDEILIRAFQEIFFDFKGTANQYLTSYTETLFSKRKTSQKHMEALLAIASGANRLPDIAGFMKKRKSNIMRYLTELVESDVIIKNGSFYLPGDPMLGFWLKNVFLKKKSSIISYIPERARDFREEMQIMLNDYAAEFEKPILDKLLSLLYSFNNESIQTGYKKYTLSKFEEVKAENISSSIKCITARVGQKSWLLHLKEGQLKDMDVLELIESIKLSGKNPFKKIIIAPAGVDRNASLLAKNEKIWIWDLNTLNLLMSVYGKPRITNLTPTG